MRPRNDRPDIQFLADFIRINLITLVICYDAAWNHSPTLEFGQTVYKALGDLVVQVLRIGSEASSTNGMTAIDSIGLPATAPTFPIPVK